MLQETCGQAACVVRLNDSRRARRSASFASAGCASRHAICGSAEFCCGERFSLADIAAGYALGYLDAALPQVEWREAHPNLARLAERLAQRESFRRTTQAA